MNYWIYGFQAYRPEFQWFSIVDLRCDSFDLLNDFETKSSTYVWLQEVTPFYQGLVPMLSWWKLPT